MKDESAQALQQNFFQEKSQFEIIEEKVKKTVFGVLNILLKFDDGSFFAELLSLINETCQFLYYPFYAPMGYIWKQPSLFNAVSSILAYFQTVVFFNNTQLYIVVFYVMLFLVLLVVVDIIYVSISMASKNKAAAVWPMRILRSLVSFIVTTLFMPLVEFFVAILECSNKDEEGNLLPYYQNYNIDDMHCWENTHFTVMCVLSIFIVIIFVLICTIVQTIFYETRTSSETAEDAKTNSLADLVALYVKIALIILYSFLVWDKGLHWIVIPATFLVAFIQFYVYWTERPFYDEKMNTAFFIHTGMFLWGTIVLFLIKLLETSAFDGGIFIFFIGLPIIVTIILTQKDNRFKLLLTNINKFEKGDLIFKQIRYFLELVDKKNKDRKSKILLKGYIYVHEEYCSLIDCPLKKYLKECEKSEKSAVNVNVNGTQTGYGMESVNNLHSSGPVLTNVGGGTTLLNTGNSTSFGNANTEADLFLFQHAMTMFQNGISKFPSCTKLRINYAFFLMERMNNSKKSLIELKNCEKYDPTFEEEFIIFRFNQNQSGNDDDNEDDDDDGLDIVSNIAYKNHYNMFKEGLTNITAIYIEFWTLLLNHSQKSDEDLAKMNEYGEKINKLIEEIKINYDEMEKLKYNDEEVLTLYSDFFQEILNDKTQSDYYKNRLRDVQGNGTMQADKGDNNELQGLPLTDEFEYIFLSAEGQNMGTIVKVSLGICSLFGYSLIDLIGKNIDFIMPDMYQENHKLVLINKLNKFKTQMTQNFRNNIKGGQKAAYREIFAFGKNKLKHAVPLSMKVTLMYTQDQRELFFAARIMNEDLYNDVHSKNPTPGLPPVINFNMKVCYVLTDLDFIVQFYTANAINFLGFKSNTAGNADITKSVSDLNNNEDRPELGKMSKSEVFKKRYFEQKKIIWKTLLNEEEEPDFHLESTTDKFNMKGLMNYSRKIMLNTSEITKTLSSSKNEVGRKNAQFLPLKRQKYKEDSFLLSVTEINILNQGVGYVFRFEVADTEDNDLDGYDDKNFLPTTPISNKPTTNSQAEFCPGFIPELNKKFDLDTHKMAFLPNSDDKESSSGVNWHNKVRDFANEKLNRYRFALEANKTQVTEEESEESDESYGDESNSLDVTSSDNYSSSINNNNNNNDNKEAKPLKEEVSSVRKSFIVRNPTVNKDDEFNYYHVKSIEMIKFSIYDFKKKRMVEIPKIKRESQVEYKKKEQANNSDINPRLKKRYEKNMAMEAEESNNEEDNGIDAILVKQIEYALRKEEFQPEVTKLKWLSFVTYASLIIISSVLFFFLIEHISIMKENLQIVSDLHQMISNVINGIYSIRELVLLNNANYTNILFDHAASVKNLTETLAILFTESYLLQQNVLTTGIKMSNQRSNKFLNGTTTVSILEDAKFVRQIELTINTAITQAFTSMYQISHLNIKDINATNYNVYFYMKNAFSPIYSCLMMTMNNFLDEIIENINSFKTNYTFILVALIVVLIASGIGVKIMYDKIIKLKSSYLEVFFEIDDNVSKKALDKCDSYAKVLHPLAGSENDTYDDDDDNAQLTPHNKQQQKQVQENSRKSKERKNEGYKNYYFILGIVIIQSLFLSYFLAVILTFEQSLDYLLEYSEQYNITAVQKHTYLLIYDQLREYFFDPGFTIDDIPIKQKVEDSLDYIYANMKNETERFKTDLLPSSYQKMYKTIYKDNLCEYTGDLFSTNNKLTQEKKDCDTFVSNSSNYGLDVLLSNYIENCRSQKYYFDSLWLIGEESEFEYNNTLYPDSTVPEDEEGKKKYNELNPFKIFNHDPVFTLTVSRKYYVEPTFTILINTFYESIIQFWKGRNDMYIILMVVLIIALTIFFLFLWIPFQKKLDKDIYKTKNMLSIIPKEVLASLKSINNLLNLGNSVPSSNAPVETK